MSKKMFMIAVVGGLLNIFCMLTAQAQQLTNILFYHHSVGNNLIVEGNMRAVFDSYNAANGTQFAFWDHGYNGDGLRNPAGESIGVSYEMPHDETYPSFWHSMFTSAEADYTYTRNQVMQYQVIAFKSCFPACSIWNDDDLQQYKTYYLGMRDFFDVHTDKLFIVMPPPPVHRLYGLDADVVARVRLFANWLKSAEYLAGHTNVVCFDLFDYLAGSDNYLKSQYELSHDDSDSHPNAAANQTVGPILANFFITSALAYGGGGGGDTAPAAPASVAASDGLFTNKVQVTWNVAAGATGYDVYKHTANDSSGAALLTNTSATSYDDTSVTPGSVYYYWVKATNTFGTSAFSSSDSGYALSGEVSLVPVYRLYSFGASESTFEHLWTTSASERDTLDSWPSWEYEGVAWDAYPAQITGTVPLYRLYAAEVKQHHYTIDTTEYNYLDQSNPAWTGEGTQYFVYPTNTVSGVTPVYRFYHEGLYLHHFTISENERAQILANPEWGYAYEGIGFYVNPTNE